MTDNQGGQLPPDEGTDAQRRREGGLAVIDALVTIGDLIVTVVLLPVRLVVGAILTVLSSCS